MGDADNPQAPAPRSAAAARLVRSLSISHFLANVGFFMLVQANADLAFLINNGDRLAVI